MLAMLGEKASDAKNNIYKNDRINLWYGISTMSDLFYISMYRLCFILITFVK